MVGTINLIMMISSGIMAICALILSLMAYRESKKFKENTPGHNEHGLDIPKYDDSAREIVEESLKDYMDVSSIQAPCKECGYRIILKMKKEKGGNVLSPDIVNCIECGRENKTNITGDDHGLD